MNKKILCFTVALLLSFTVAGATVVDKQAPYFGDYLFVYNGSESEVSVSPLSSVSAQSFSVLETEDMTATEAERVHWSPDVSDLVLPTGLEETVPTRLQNTIMYSTTSPELGDTLTYLVSNPRTGERYSQDFIYLGSGSYCNILVEPDEDGNPKLTSEDVTKLATEFDTNIQPFMVENFGDYYTYMGVYQEKYLQYSKNTKMDILLYDIQDGFNNTTVRSYVGGYTDLTDFITEELGGNGNERGILHIDIYPLMGLTDTPNIEKCYSTIVHEFQHQISYSDSLFDYFTGKLATYVNETWWNEAFSMAAEHLYTGSPLTYRINSYNQSTDSVPLRKGLVLGYNDYAENDNHTASNYSTSYLFGQYLRCQTKGLTGGSNQIYRTILEQTGTDYTTILAGLSSIGYAYTPATFEELYRNFRMATILKNSTGPYGFAGESAFSGLADNVYTGTSAVTLKSGAAIVLQQPENFTPESDSTLSYTAFSNRGVYSYALNAVGDDTINVTHGNLPQSGIRLLAAGYSQSDKLLGADEITVVTGIENYNYNLPAGSVIKKFFLFAADGSLKPLAYAEVQ